jgi:hypothetical protein
MLSRKVRILGKEDIFRKSLDIKNNKKRKEKRVKFLFGLSKI